MKVVILAGGLGTRISEESQKIPKPLVEIGGQPILWHIMKIYGHHGFSEFVICLGFKGYAIKDYFNNYYLHRSNVTINLATGQCAFDSSSADPWTVALIDTGLGTLTGGRIKRIRPYIGNETFCLTYGDGVADIDLKALLDFHKSSGKLATVTAIRQPARFGGIQLEGGTVTRFQEKSLADGQWINGGFFVLEPEIFNYIEGDETTWEREPLERLARDGQLAAYCHDGFWQSMDTLREKNLLQDAWDSGEAPWKIWR